MPYPEVIFFDAAGTLFELTRPVGETYVAVAARHGIALTPAAVTVAFRKAWRELPAPAETPGPRPDDDRGWWRALVDRVLAGCAVAAPPATVDAYFADVYAHFALPGVWRLFPEVPEVLAALRGRCRLGLITNFDGRIRPVLAELGLGDTFSPLIISSEVGADKPSPRIFELALQAAGVAPDAALHVGDDPDCDWRGGEAAGLRTFRLDRSRGTLRELVASLDA